MFCDAAQRKVQDARRRSCALRHAVDQDEAARVAVVDVGIERDRLVEVKIADADLVELQRLRREMLERVDVDLVLRLRRSSRRRVFAPIFSEIGRAPAASARPAIQMTVRLELVGDFGERDPPRPARRRGSRRSRPSSVSVIDWPATARVEIAVHRDDARDRAFAARRAARATSSPGTHRAADDRARRSRGNRDSGRLTHCTGRRNGPRRRPRSSISTVSR